jgi:2-polyprenyl-6-methoxyphenol hydroxylase-like FAD-dependent oxidoreductase
VARYTGKPEEVAFYLNDSLKPLSRYISNDNTFIRANRARMRSWLSSDIPVQWNKRYVSHTIDPHSRVTITFEDGRQASGDVLVGADGVGSRVRASFDSTLLPTLPIGVIAGETTVRDDVYDRARALGNSFFIVSGEAFRLIVALRESAPDCSSGEYYWLFYWQDSGIAQHGVDCWPMNGSQNEKLQFVKDRLREGKIHPSFAEVIEQQAPEGIHPSFVLRDRVPTICPEGPVTLIGDAAHAMTPSK